MEKMLFSGVIMTKYQSVIDDIKDRILNGVWPSGSLIPGEMELCRIYDVSRITVRRALEELSSAGYAMRIQGKGTFASIPPQLQSGSSKLGFAQYMGKNGIEVVSKLLADERVEADSNIKRKLLLHDDEKHVWHFRRVRIVKGIPIAVMDTYVRIPTADKMRSYDLERESFFSLYERIFGKGISRNIFSISAVVPDKDVQKQLKMPRISAGILLESTAFIEDEAPVQYDISVFNPAYYKFTSAEATISPTSL